MSQKENKLTLSLHLFKLIQSPTGYAKNSRFMPGVRVFPQSLAGSSFLIPPVKYP
jgi:hypothetical protein